MEATELRIRNLVDFNGNIATVLELRENFARIEYTRSDNGERHAPLIEYTKLKPIKITEERLLKFGFEERKESDNFSKWGLGENPQTKDWMLLIKQFKDEVVFFFQNGYHRITNVHQLQNLHFALTGEEL